MIRACLVLERGCLPVPFETPAPVRFACWWPGLRRADFAGLHCLRLRRTLRDLLGCLDAALVMGPRGLLHAAFSAALPQPHPSDAAGGAGPEAHPCLKPEQYRSNCPQVPVFSG